MIRKRISGQVMSENVGEPVILLGKIVRVTSDGKAVEIQTTDQVKVNVTLPEPIDGNAEGCIEVSGTVKSGSTMLASSFTIFPLEMTECFSVDVYNELLLLQNILGDKKWRFSDDTTQPF